MTIEELKQEKENLDYKIKKLQSYIGMGLEKEIMFPEYMASSIEFVPEVLPAAFLPAMFGVEMYGMALDEENSLPAKIALTALVTPLAIPAIGISLLLALPLAIPVMAISAIAGGVQATYATAYNSRTSKAKKKLDMLIKKRDEITNEIQKYTTR